MTKTHYTARTVLCSGHNHWGRLEPIVVLTLDNEHFGPTSPLNDTLKKPCRVEGLPIWDFRPTSVLSFGIVSPIMFVGETQVDAGNG